MTLSNAGFGALYTVGAIALIASAWTINRQWQARTSIRAAALMMMAVSLWLSFQVAETLSANVEAKRWAIQGQYCCMLIVSTAWLVWVLLYTRNRSWVTPWTVGTLLAADAFVVALVVTNEHHRLIWSEFYYDISDGGVLQRMHGAAYWGVWVYLYAVFAVGITLLGKAYLNAGRIYRWEVTMLLLVSVVPWFFGLVDALEVNPYMHRRFDVAAAAVSSTLAAWLLFRLRSRHLIPVARQAILDSLADAVVVIDPMGKIIDTNRSGREIFGMPARSLANRSLAEFWIAMPSLSELKSHHDGSREVVLSCEDASRVYDLRTSSIRDGGRRIVCHIFVFRDVTDRKRTEREGERLREELQYSRRLESLALFAGGMAHEFNNTLTRMLVHTNLAQDSLPERAPALNHLHAVERQIGRASELAEQILAYSGRGRFMVEQICLVQLVRLNIPILKGLMARGAELDCDLGTTVPRIEADPLQVRLMLTHLCTNAVESLGKASGRVALRVEVEHLGEEQLRKKVYCHPGASAGEYVVLQVCDNGCGMDDGTLGRMFDPFFSTKFTGRGLGLAAVLGIVRGHRGWIDVDSHIDRGTTVRVAFPAVPAASAHLSIQAAPMKLQVS